MLLNKVACPHCQTTLKSQRGIPQGWSITCRKCGAAFTAEAAAATTVLQAAPFAPPPSPSAITSSPSRVTLTPLPYDPDAAEPVHSEPGNHAMLLCLVFGGLLLFLGMGAALALYCFRFDDAPSSAPQPTAGPVVQRFDEPVAVVNKLQPPADPTRIEPKATKPRPATKPTVTYDPPKFDFVVDKNKPAPTVWTTLSPEDQQRVNQAIDKGVRYLRGSQLGGGSWTDETYTIGNAALPGLVLLECGAKTDDPAVLKAATHVRFYSSTLKHTYQLSLAILFLDRLGDKKDKQLIQTLALRLIAGQNMVGGWDYNCPVLDVPEHHQLLTFLRQTRPQLQNPIPRGADPLKNPVTTPHPDGKAPLDKPADPLRNAVPNPSDKPADTKNPKVIAPLPTDEAKKVIAPVQPPDSLPPHIRQLAIAQNQPKGKGKGKAPAAGRDDNSNTQFAIMALWVARRHDVPIERTTHLVEQRFRTSQTAEGGWGYHYPSGAQTPAMTCVGLLGLAMGHGATHEILMGTKGQDKIPPTTDPAIEKGLKALGQHVENPTNQKRNGSAGNLYFLWSLERVAMLYNLRTIGNKDWYGWGVELLLPSQRDNGSWQSGGYPGATATIDTCFALLFLKRTNLVQDLTDNLRLYVPITDPDAPGRIGPR
jgi:hypothetical protein